MNIDKEDYYPYVPGSRDDDDTPESEVSPQLPSVASGNGHSCRQMSSGNQDDGGELPPSTPGHEAADHICQALSWLLVPLMMPVYGVILAFSFSSLQALPFATKFSFSSVAFLFNAIIPMCLILILKKMGLVEDIGLNGRKERLIPYIITVAVLGATAVFFQYKHAPSWLWLFVIGGATAGIVNLGINFFWKISAHAAGIAGIVAIMVELCRINMPNPTLTGWTVAIILLAGMLGSARIWMQRHTVSQVMAGYAVGFLSVWLTQMIA